LRFGRGGAQPLDWDGLRAHRRDDGWLWVHLQREATGSRAWLENESGLDERMGPEIDSLEEDLDAARERAQIVQEELAARISEQINRNMYVLSIVAAVFLPLRLITGYLGINVGGIPGTDGRWSFALVGIGLGLIALLEVWLLRRLRWI
jgi:zinc transporter